VVAVKNPAVSLSVVPVISYATPKQSNPLWRQSAMEFFAQTKNEHNANQHHARFCISQNTSAIIEEDIHFICSSSSRIIFACKIFILLFEGYGSVTITIELSRLFPICKYSYVITVFNKCQQS
jgi:hypothetical protein